MKLMLTKLCKHQFPNVTKSGPTGRFVLIVLQFVTFVRIVQFQLYLESKNILWPIQYGTQGIYEKINIKYMISVQIVKLYLLVKFGKLNFHHEYKKQIHNFRGKMYAEDLTCQSGMLKFSYPGTAREKYEVRVLSPTQKSDCSVLKQYAQAFAESKISRFRWFRVGFSSSTRGTKVRMSISGMDQVCLEHWS